MQIMKEKPILFNTEMVKAILEGRKTQTRRVINPQPEFKEGTGFHWKGRMHGIGADYQETVRNFTKWNCPLGRVGDYLWVRETFTQGYDMTLLKDEGDDIDAVSIIYKADGAELYRECPKSVAENWGDWSCDGEGDPVFKPSIHMPRWASRINLLIKKIRVERLNDISEQDCLKEGIGSPITRDCKKPKFLSLWSQIYGEESLNANPWVWVVEFELVKSAAHE